MVEQRRRPAGSLPSHHKNAGRMMALLSANADASTVPRDFRDRCRPLSLEHDRVFEAADTTPRDARPGAAAVRVPSAIPRAFGGTPRRAATRTRCDTRG